MARTCIASLLLSFLSDFIQTEALTFLSRRSNLSMTSAPTWQKIESGKSGTHDDAPTSANCPSGTTLTGCSCYSPWASCDGAKADGNTCIAYNKWGGSGVFAEARCGPISESSNWQEVLSGKSGTHDDAPTSANCPSGTTLTGCSCYSPWGSCYDGAKAAGNTCTAYNNVGGGGVFAQARCGNIPGSADWEEVLSGKSGTHDDAPTSANCPSGKTLTGCSCYSPWAGCDGAKPAGNTCTAYNKHGGGGVFAQARCGVIPLPTPSPTPSPTPACTDCTGRQRASVEGNTLNKEGESQSGESFCYRHNHDLLDDESACAQFWAEVVGSTDHWPCTFVAHGSKAGANRCKSGSKTGALKCCPGTASA